jgi:pyruvate-formate lyase-activating enzyme
VSTYELGHQPWHLASPASALERAGHDVRMLDLAVDGWDDSLVAWADAVALSVPMHTAMRLAHAAAARVRSSRPDIPLCFYGLYAGMAGEGEVGLVGEYEAALTTWAAGVRPLAAVVDLGRYPYHPPARSALPSLDRYARFVDRGGEHLVGYVETTHGCAHRCRHCPVPVVYDGRVRMVTENVVLTDIAQLVEAGAGHITFGDPDFLNAPQHAQRIVRAMHAAFPDVTFDCTVKVEHILRHADVWAEWSASGCAFVVSAVECLSDDILRRLDKGHTAADASAAVALLRSHGVELRPSLLPFTPWTAIEDVLAIVHFVVDHDLIGNVDPVQYTIRLLIPEGSLLLGEEGVDVGPYDGSRLSYEWQSRDPRVDELQRELAALVESNVARGEDIAATFMDVNAAVHRAAGAAAPEFVIPPGSIEGRPRLTEPWFC